MNKIFLSIGAIILSLSITGCEVTDGDGYSSNDGVTDIIEVQLDNATSNSIYNIHNNGDVAACKMSVGTYEYWKKDAYKFFSNDYRNTVSYDNDKIWLDIISNDVANIMLERIDQAAYVNCDIVIFEDVDIYNFNSGFNINSSDVGVYLDFLIDQAHSYNMQVGASDIDVYDNAFIENKFDVITY